MLNVKDPYLLLSVINTKLRDESSSLDDLCLTYNENIEEIKNRLQTIGYSYNVSLNQFICA